MRCSPKRTPMFSSARRHAHPLLEQSGIMIDSSRAHWSSPPSCACALDRPPWLSSWVILLHTFPAEVSGVGTASSPTVAIMLLPPANNKRIHDFFSSSKRKPNPSTKSATQPKGSTQTNNPSSLTFSISWRILRQNDNSLGTG